MKRKPGLLLRGGRYYARLRVPQNLVPILGRHEIKKALNTSDLTEALAGLDFALAEIQEQFAAARREIKQKVEKVSPSLTESEATRLSYIWFKRTERESIEDAFRQPELNAVALQDAYEQLSILLDGGDEEVLPLIQQTADSVLIGAGFPSKPAPKRPGPIQPSIQRRVPDIDKTSATYQKLCERIHRGMIENVRRQQQRYKGQATVTVDPIFSPEIVEKAASGPLLSAVLEMWLAERKPNRKTANEWQRVVTRFTELHGDLAVDAITKAHVRQFKDALLKVPASLSQKDRNLSLPKILAKHKGSNQPTLSPQTVVKMIAAIKSILSWAMNNGYVEHNAATGVTVATAKNTDESRIAYSKNDLKTIFESIGQFRDSKPTNFWLPLLAAFTGARLEELGQLTGDDIREQDGIDYISINADGGKKVKTLSSIRDVPIHPELVKCGFLDYVAACRKSETRRLFPDLRPDQYGIVTTYYSSQWTMFRREIGIDNPRKVFHSFRHSFKEACREADIGEEIHDSLTGHSNGSIGRGYGGVPLATKADAIKRINLGVKLAYLYR